MRCFIAIILPDRIRDEIAKLQAELRRGGLKLRWVPPENIHLTLKFLGEITEEQSVCVGSLLAQVAAQTSAFELAVEGVGQFPPKGVPRVVWVGAGGDIPRLLDLEQRIREGLDRESIAYDKKPFHPHLTIARVDRAFRGPLRLGERWRAFRAGSMVAERVDLMKSDLLPAGARYTSLSHSRLLSAGG